MFFIIRKDNYEILGCHETHEGSVSLAKNLAYDIIADELPGKRMKDIDRTDLDSVQRSLGGFYRVFDEENSHVTVYRKDGDNGLIYNAPVTAIAVFLIKEFDMPLVNSASSGVSRGVVIQKRSKNDTAGFRAVIDELRASDMFAKHSCE
jgi:hypothetical protein